MKWINTKLTDISNPKQWKNLPISEMSEDGFLVYGANGIIGKYKEYNHEFQTLAITCRGATCGTLNITEPKSYITSNAMSLDDVSKDVDQKFLYYALKKRGFKDIITGAAQPQITREGLNKIVLTIPENISDQIQIANILSKAETLIEQRKQSIALLDELLKSSFLEMFGDPVTNEKGWEVTKLESICEFENGDRSSNYPIKEEFVNEGIIFINSSNIIDFKFNPIDPNFITKEKFNSLSNGKCNRGDILFTLRGNGLGKCCVFNGIYETGFVNAQIVIIRPKQNCNNYFLIEQFRNPKIFTNIWKLGSGSAQPQLPVVQLKKLKIILPPVELQNVFAALVMKTESQKEKCKNSLTELENLYGSLSQRAFKGELELSNM